MIAGLAFTPTGVVLAQNETPPPDTTAPEAETQIEPQTEETEPAAADEGETVAEPTQEVPVVDEPVGEEPPVDETVEPPTDPLVEPTEEAAAEPQPTQEPNESSEVEMTSPETLTEVLDVIADTGAVLVDGEGNEVPLASQTAAEVLSEGNDPWFTANDGSGTVVGYTTIGGTCHPTVTECHQVDRPLTGALMDSRSNNQVVNLLAGYYDEYAGLGGKQILQGIQNGSLLDAVIREIALPVDVTIGSHVVSPLVWVEWPGKIQDAIDLVQAGGTVNVFPERYHEKAEHRTVNGGTEEYQFGLYIGPDKDGITIQQVSLHGAYPPTDCCGVTFIYTDATNNFGYSGVFVEADNVTFNGFTFMDNLSGNNKTIEVIGNNFTLKNSAIEAVDGSVYINDWNFNAATQTSSITAYTIQNNHFLNGSSLDISSGAGYSGSPADRRIVNNLFDGKDPTDGSSAVRALTSFNGIVPSVGWYVYPVGGATIQGNTYRNGLIYIRSRGDVDEDSFDWESYWNDNTFQHGVITLQDLSTFDPREYAYDSSGYLFNDVRRIGSVVQDEIDNVAQDGDTVLLGPGTFMENLIVDKPLEVAGSGSANTILMPAFSNPDCGGSPGGSLCPGASNIITVQADDVTIRDMTLDGDNYTLPSLYTINSANIDARNGIITNHTAGIFNNLNVFGTVVKNIFLRGIYASSGGTFDIHDNMVMNVNGDAQSIAMMNFGGSGRFVSNHVVDSNDGIVSNWSTGTQYLYNTVENSGTGIHTDNFGSLGPGNELIQHNFIKNSPNGYGIFVFAPFNEVIVDDNRIENVLVGLAASGSNCAAGACNGHTIFSNNNVNGMWNPASIGALVTTDMWGWGYGPVAAEFIDNFIHNNGTGIYLEDEETPNNPGYAYEGPYGVDLNAYHNGIVNNTVDVHNFTSSLAFVHNNYWNDNNGPQHLEGNQGSINWYEWIKLGLMVDPAVIPVYGTSELDSYMFSTGDWQSAPIEDMWWFYPLDVFNYEETDLGDVYWNVFTAGGQGGTAELSSYYFGKFFQGLAYIDIIAPLQPFMQEPADVTPELEEVVAEEPETVDEPPIVEEPIEETVVEVQPINVEDVTTEVDIQLGGDPIVPAQMPMDAVAKDSIALFMEEDDPTQSPAPFAVLTCTADNTLALTGGSVALHAPLCGFSAQATMQSLVELPAPLPDGLTFRAALALTVSSPMGLPAEVSFALPAGMDGADAVVLSWDAAEGTWVELPARFTTSAVTATVPGNGWFVLAE